jgi:acyl-CoA thioesterase I
VGACAAAAACGAPEANGVAMDAQGEADARARVLVVGTSLTAGPGLPPEETYPTRLQEMVDSAGLPYRVVNAGVSGETSAGALRRLEWLLREPAAVVVVETGANDMLRGLDPDSTRGNLERIIARLHAAEPRPRVLLVGMRALPNLGRDYAESFEAIYLELAERHGLDFEPFLLEGVAGEPEMNLADGIHPNAAGHSRMARNIWPALEGLLVRNLR